jgi:hypothetical protein
MGQDRIPQRGVRQAGHHRHLNHCHHFPSTCPKRGEAQDAVTIRLDQSLEEAACLGEGSSSQHGYHWNFELSIGNAALLRLPFSQPDPRQFGIREQTERYQTPGGNVLDSSQVVSNDPEVIEGDVGEIGASCAIPNCPYSLCRGLQAFVYPNMTSIIQLDPGQFEPDPIGVRGTTSGNE